MQSIVFGKTIVQRLFVLLFILLFPTACDLNKSKEFELVPQPIDNPDNFEEQIELLDRDLTKRRAVYQRQLVWEKQELDSKIDRLPRQLLLANKSTSEAELNRLLQEQVLVQEKIDILFKSDDKNWEEAVFIADEALANLQKSYDSFFQSQLGTKSHLENNYRLNPTNSYSIWDVYRI